MDVGKQLYGTIARYDMLRKKERLLVGVSGGPDSVCLLHLLQGIKERYHIELVCAHFNHGLREEADYEEKFVRRLCRQMKIRCLTEKKDVKKFFKGDSLEQTARLMRFDFFRACARECRCKKIALAHNKDDAVETVLMRIIRGTALKGLRGILPCSKVSGLSVIRPLIETEKKDIVRWLDENGYEYMTDSSNFEEVFLRNKIRLSLIPALKKLNPNVTGVLFNLGRISALDYEYIESTAGETFASLKKQKGRGTIKIDVSQLRSLTRSLFLNVIRQAIEEVRGHTRALEFRHFEELWDLLHTRPVHSVVDLPGLTVKKDEHWLSIKSLLF